MQQRLWGAEHNVGSATRAELTNLFKAFGLPLAELLTAETQKLLQTTVAARDAHLVAQSQPLDQQAMAATLAQLHTIGCCLAFRKTLAQAVAAASLKPSPEDAAMQQLPPISLANMREQADPALAQAISQPEVAQRWLAWRTITGAHASQEQTAQLWQALGSSGARFQLMHNLEALRMRSDRASTELRTAPGPPMVHTTDCGPPNLSPFYAEYKLQHYISL